MLRALPGAPIITVASVAVLTGHSQTSAGEAVNLLARADILQQRNVGRQRYGVFEAPDVLDLFGDVQNAINQRDRGHSPI